MSEVLALDRVHEEKTGLEDLSPREFEIFRMILDARSTDEIAAALNVSRKTVANYHYSIKSKLGRGFPYPAPLFRPAARAGWPRFTGDGCWELVTGIISETRRVVTWACRGPRLRCFGMGVGLRFARRE